MSLFEDIKVEIHRFVDDRRDCAILSPAAVAVAIYAKFVTTEVDARIAYAAHEHFKHMARKELAARFEDRGEDNPAYSGQGELFSGHLQERYPVPRKKDEDPVYKRLQDLTQEELRWNVRSLRRSADARLAHADALAAYASSAPEAA